MSRAILKMMLARAIKHEPTDTELTDFLAHARDLAGERIYIPQCQPVAEDVHRILALRADGWSVRRIAKEVSVSKSQVHRALSQNPDLFGDSD